MQAWRSRSVPELPAPSQAVRVRATDTATGELVEVGPAAGTARVYVCGITPYDATHIGHANTYVAFDLLNRAWRDAGLTVDYVQNVTDVDDPLLERAQRDGVDWSDLAAAQIELFRADMEALNVLAPTSYVGAVEAVPLIVELIEKLLGEGIVYAVDDADHPDLYFEQAADPDFGFLSRLSDAEARGTFAERGGDPERPGKRAPLDCLAWRLERPGEPAWDAPFGRGRPGWHSECAAIALDRLGAAFDVQAGGRDLIFPHHEMSAAEAHVVSGEAFARAYLHSGMVSLDGEKMSKSRGNLVFVSALRRDGVDPMAIRLALLSQHYRSDWSWTGDVLDVATRRLATWREAVRLTRGPSAADVLDHIRQALARDLDAPAALATVDAWAAASLAINHHDAADADADADAPALVARACEALLGITL